MAVTITLLTPTNGAEDVDQTPSCTANFAGDVDDPFGSQTCEIYLNGAFNKSFAGWKLGNEALWFAAALAAQTTYTWKVRGFEYNPVPPPDTQEVWSAEFSFTTGGLAKPTTPSPTDADTGIKLARDLGWVNGGGATSYDVYFGLPGAMTKVSDGQEGLTYTIAGLSYNTEYNWRVDAWDSSTPPETVEGDTWSYTCLAFSPPLPSGVTLDGSGTGDGGPTGTATGLNNILTPRKLITAAGNKIWMEDI